MPIVIPEALKTNATELIKKFEGFKPEAYKLKGEAYPTVGYGTSLTPDKAGIFQRLFGDKLNFNSVSSTNQAVTPQQGTALLGDHLTSISNRLQKMIPKLPTYNPELQGALLNGAYRGDVFQSPKAVGLMNKGDWAGGAKEYLNNNEFKASLTNGMSGVKNRMQYNADVFAKQPMVKIQSFVDWMQQNPGTTGAAAGGLVGGGLVDPQDHKRLMDYVRKMAPGIVQNQTPLNKHFS